MDISQKMTELTGIDFEGSESTASHKSGGPSYFYNSTEVYLPYSQEILVGTLRWSELVTVEFHDYAEGDMKRFNNLTLEQAARRIKKKLKIA